MKANTLEGATSINTSDTDTGWYVYNLLQRQSCCTPENTEHTFH